VDLLEQCVAHAIAHGDEAVTPADAEAVARRMVGMPVSPGARLADLRQRLEASALLGEDDARAFLARLEVTVRGLDLRAARPNAVVLLLGEAAVRGDELASRVAESLFGSADRVVSIDFSRMVHPADVTLLVGAPPGYIGYSDSLAIHKVAQAPWSVLRCDNVHAAHPQVREVLIQALTDGFFTDSLGKRVYLSDAVVVMTADLPLAAGPRGLGFGRTAAATPALSAARRAAEETFGRSLVAQCDVVCAVVPTGEEARRRWLAEQLLPDLSERYHEHGVGLAWDSSVVEWLIGQSPPHATPVDWERLVDQKLSPLLIPHLPGAGGDEKRLLVRCVNGKIEVAAEERKDG
jgi:ATP-dependent Clp protease ATP-binding subunit ClpC